MTKHIVRDLRFRDEVKNLINGDGLKSQKMRKKMNDNTNIQGLT